MLWVFVHCHMEVARRAGSFQGQASARLAQAVLETLITRLASASRAGQQVTCRTDQGRFLLRPGPVIDDILLGVLGRAQRLYPVEICAFSFLSSHYHLLLWVPDARSMARFMW